MMFRQFFKPTAKELRERARQKFEQAIAIRRHAPSLSLSRQREFFLVDAAQLQAEAEALEAQAAELEPKSG